MIYDKISKQFIDMNPNQIGSEVDRFVILNEEQIQRANEIINEGHFNEDYMLNGTITAPTLDVLKGIKLGELNTNYINKLAKGLNYNLNGVDYKFNLDDNTEDNIAKQKIDWDIQKTQDDYDENTIAFAITNADKHQVIFNLTTFLNFSAAFGRILKSIKIDYASKRNAIALSETIEELNAVGITFGEE